MTDLVVDVAARMLRVGERDIPCVLGRSGACEAARKREGDGFTPLGRWPIKAALLRPDRGLSPPTALPWRWLRPADGWSDDPADPAYNRPVSHPHRFSAEQLWRDDALYDAIIVLGHNDHPPVPSLGSAIFLHVRGGDTTEGCVAIDRGIMPRLLDHLAAGDFIEIR